MLLVRPTFTNIVNASVLVVCVILGVSVTLQLVDRFSRRQPATAATTVYRVGDVMPALSDYSFSSADATLVLAVRSTCGFCTKSMPFYRRLIDDIKGARVNATVVAVSIDSIEELKQYFDAHTVSPELFRAVSSEYLRIVGTPTILLVDPSGVVKNAWIGLLDAEGEAAVLSAIRHVKTRSES